MIDLNLIRIQLMAINERLGDGWVVSASWDGKVLTVITRPKNVPAPLRLPWVLTMESESDYALYADKQIDDFVAGAKQWFNPVGGMTPVREKHQQDGES